MTKLSIAMALVAALSTTDVMAEGKHKHDDKPSAPQPVTDVTVPIEQEIDVPVTVTVPIEQEIEVPVTVTPVTDVTVPIEQEFNSDDDITINSDDDVTITNKAAASSAYGNASALSTPQVCGNAESWGVGLQALFAGVSASHAVSNPASVKLNHGISLDAYAKSDQGFSRDEQTRDNPDYAKAMEFRALATEGLSDADKGLLDSCLEPQIDAREDMQEHQLTVETIRAAVQQNVATISAAASVNVANIQQDGASERVALRHFCGANAYKPTHDEHHKCEIPLDRRDEQSREYEAPALLSLPSLTK